MQRNHSEQCGNIDNISSTDMAWCFRTRFSSDVFRGSTAVSFIVLAVCQGAYAYQVRSLVSPVSTLALLSTSAIQTLSPSHIFFFLRWKNWPNSLTWRLFVCEHFMHFYFNLGDSIEQTGVSKILHFISSTSHLGEWRIGRVFSVPRDVSTQRNIWSVSITEHSTAGLKIVPTHWTHIYTYFNFNLFCWEPFKESCFSSCCKDKY